jgi:twitching motility two-component system response regulator PilH
MAIRKVLVVDDVSTDLRHLQSIISGAGYQVVTAASGREALQKVQTDKPDLIFLDIVMEDMDGYQACRKLCTGADTKHIPVVMVSGNTQRIDKLWAQKQGARGYVTKPYSVDDITKQIAKFR